MSGFYPPNGAKRLGDWEGLVVVHIASGSLAFVREWRRGIGMSLVFATAQTIEGAHPDEVISRPGNRASCQDGAGMDDNEARVLLAKWAKVAS